MFINYSSNVVLLARLAHRGLLVALISFVVLLSGCGNGASDDNAPLVSTPHVVSVSAKTEVITIDLNVSQSVNFDVVTRFDDDSDKITSFIAVWSAENKSLSVTGGDENAPIKFDYDVDALINTGTSITITDDLLPENVVVILNLIPVEVVDVAIVKILPQVFPSNFFVNDNFQLSIKAENSDASIVDDVLPLVVCSVETNLFISVTEQCEITALSAGEVDVIVALVGDASISSSIKITVVPIPVLASISNLIPEALTAPFYIDDTVQLAVKAKKSDDTFVENALSLVVCSVVINAVVNVGEDCMLTAVGAGSVTIHVTLKADNAISAIITINVTAAPVPILVSSILPEPLVVAALYVDDIYSLAIKAKKSDDSIVDDALTLVTCSVVNELIATVTSGCELTATGSGVTDVLISLKANTDISATLSIRVLPSIHFVENQVSIEAGKNLQLTLAGKFSNALPATDLFQWVKCSTSSAFFSVTENCVVTAQSEGVSDVSLTFIDENQSVVTLDAATVTVTAPVIVTELIVSGGRQLWVGSSKVLMLSAKLSDGSVLNDARSIAKCIKRPFDSTIITVLDDCTVTGNIEGSAGVSAELITQQLNAPTVTPFNLTVTTAPEILASVPVSIAPGGWWFEHKFSGLDPAYTYKVKLTSLEVDPLDEFIAFDIKPTPGLELSDKICYNKPTSDLKINQKTIACGIDMSGTLGDLYVFFENRADVFVDGFEGTLELTLDDDILNNDNQGKQFPSSITDYVVLQVGSEYSNGHVSSNELGANISRYRTDVDNGLLSSTSGYQVAVTFQPDKAGNYNIDLDNVRLGWQFGSADAKPFVYCTRATCACAIVGANSIVCDVLSGGLSDLFLFVYGNGFSDFSSSPATADGELSYTVIITNTP